MKNLLVCGQKGKSFSPGKKTLLRLFRDRQEAMNEYFDEHRFNFEDPRDLAKIFARYESLKNIPSL